MKRRNLVIATILSLSVVMLTACGGSEEGKETTTKQKTEVESSITVADNDATEEETTKDDTTTENTTIVVDNETTGEETTTKVDETSKQETTTKKQEATTAKPTTTQKETTTKKQETTTVKPTTTQKETTTKQPQTTTKQEQTTTKEEETTTEVWNKTVYEEAAINLMDTLSLDYYAPLLVSFNDFTLDGVPDLFLMYPHSATANESGKMYTYNERSKCYEFFSNMSAFNSVNGTYEALTFYKDKNTNGCVIMEVAFSVDGLAEENYNTMYYRYDYTLFDTYNNVRKGQGYILSNDEKTLYYNASGEKISKEEFNKNISDIESKYIKLDNMTLNSYSCWSDNNEDLVREAYEYYLD